MGLESTNRDPTIVSKPSLFHRLHLDCIAECNCLLLLLPLLYYRHLICSNRAPATTTASDPTIVSKALLPFHHLRLDCIAGCNCLLLLAVLPAFDLR